MPHRAGTIGRHPQYAPLPGPPSESESESDYFGRHNGAEPTHLQNHEESGYDDLMREVDAAISQGRTSSRAGRSSQSFRPSSQEAISEEQEFDTPSRVSPQIAVSPDERPTHINGGLASTGEQYIHYGAFSDDSDAEAAAGLAAMQAAEEQEAAEEARRRSGSTSLFSRHDSQRQPSTQRTQHDVSSDSDYANIDMGLVGGGYEASMSYGGEIQSNYAAAAAMPQGDNHQLMNPRMSSLRSSGRSSDGRSSQTSGYESIPGQDAIHPFPPFRHVDVARVDTGGTGGLTEPSPHARRLSFEDGDEANMVDSETGQTSGSVSPSKDSMPDLFFFPGMSPQRPLPPAPSVSDPGRIPHLIPAGTYSAQGSRYDSQGRPYPSAPNSFAQTYLNPSQVPRSTSLAGARSAPRTEQPIRSKTDADRAKILKQQYGSRPASEVYETSGPGSSVGLDLPAIPRKKFNPAKLTKDQYKKCDEPWALSSVVAWIRDLAEEETDLKEQALAQAFIALFTFAVPTMNMTDAETLGDRVVKEMLSAGALAKEEEWVKFGSGTVSGVLFQLTKKGCYSWTVHEPETKGKCYSYHCMRTLRKVDLSLAIESEKSSDDWATFYHMTKEDAAKRDRKEVERQNVLHEIVTTEVSYVGSLDIVRVLYRDSLLHAQPPVIQSKKVSGFCRDVFGKIDQVKKVNEDYLLAQLKYRQKEQGPWVVGFSDIFREWIRKAKSVYIDYAAGFPHADFLVRKEASRNILFKQFLDQARDDRRSQRLAWDTYLKSPITRLQRYGLLLSTVLRSTVKDSEEKLNLQFAIDEIKAATFECNAKVAEMERKMELLELKDKLRLRRGMEKEVVLNLDHLGRELILRGDLLRAGGKGFQWVDTHALLFDHYLVLAKTVVGRDSAGGAKYEHYDVSKVPIPMDLIVLESSNDDPVVKGSAVKSIGGISTMTATPRGVADPRLARTTSTLSGSSAPATVVTTSSSSTKDSNSINKTMVTTTVLESNAKDDKIIYPFRIKHLGKSEVYTLYAPSQQSRTDWCEAIVSAKTSHAAALFAQNAEPFRLKVLADTAFGYDSLSGPSRRAIIRGTPLDRAISEVEGKYDGQNRPGPVCRAVVNCATAFSHPPGRLMCAIGTDYGVYFSEYNNPRGWSRVSLPFQALYSCTDPNKAIQMTRVTQIAVFEEFNLFLLISDKSLIAYHLDAVCPPAGAAAPPNDASARKAPQKLSGNKDVGFFATGRMKDRALVFYKKKDGISSTFKVLEPILQKATTTRSRFLPSPARRGQTDFFREYDEFYIPAECYSINLFHSSLAISTARGVEVLTLDKKQPWSVPNLRSEQPETQAHLSSIAARIKDLKPLGMFRLSEAEFIVAFEECAVYVNKHGDVSRGVVMEFVGKATSACLYGQHLILFDTDFVEIRNAMNGRMKQVIAGKDIKMLDDGGGSNTIRSTNGGLGGGINGLGLQGYGAAPRTVKISMQHPEHERSQVVVELIENEGRKE
jgi:CNH domain/RhoGEF domain/Pleckstrin homology domain